jgi:transcriptional regulator with XRE-family HTH domain
MDVMSSPSRQKSWQNKRERVSVLATLAVQKETVSRVLAELREQHKPPGSDKPLSQERAAARVGVTGRQWQRWESGESEPYLRNLEAVASEFNIPVSRVLDMNEQDDATTSVLSLEEVRAEFRVPVEKILNLLDRQSQILERIEAAIRLLPEVRRLEEIEAEQAESPPAQQPELADGEDRRAGADRRRRAG